MPSGLFTGLYGGTYDVLITDDHTCQLIVEVEVDLPEPIVIAIGTPVSTFCSGQEITLSTSVLGGVLPYSFEWFEVMGSDTNTVSTDSIPNLTLSETTIYFLEVTDANDCSVTSFDVLINVYPPLELNVVTPIDGAISVCPGDEVAITVSGSGGNGNYSYYSMPDHVEITGFPIFYIANSDSILIYQVEDGCTVTPGIASIDVTLHDIPEVQISVDDYQGCPSLEVNFSDVTNPGLDGLVWNFGDGTPTESGLMNVNHVYESSGYFTVSVAGYTMYGCPVSGAFEDFIYVWPTPVANFAVTADTVLLYEATIDFTDQSMANIVSWFWEFGDGEVDVIENPTHTYTDTGNYIVPLEGFNDYGCWDTTNHVVVVIPEYAFWVPNAFTPDDDNLNETFAGEGDGVNWSEYEMNIYNRWGELIYRTTDEYEPWDGYYRGSLVEMGIYVYTIQVSELRGAKHYYNGQFTVLR